MALPRFPDMPLCSEVARCGAAQLHAGAGHAERQYLHPRFMAEEVCQDALKQQLRARRNGSQMHTAWGALEFGLTLQDRPDDAEAFFNYAEHTFLDLCQHSEKALTKINAQTGLIFMPAYRARHSRQPLSRRSVDIIHYNIAEMLDSFDETYDPRGLDKYAGVKPELVTLELFARLRSFEWLAYPASPREENTDITDFNHDSYVIRGGLKIPIQVKRKSGSGYDKSVAVVRLHSILQRVNSERQRRTTQLWGNKRKATRPLRPIDADDFARLIVREAKGEWLTEHEEWLLELGSMVAVQEVMEKEAVIRTMHAHNRGRVALAA